MGGQKGEGPRPPGLRRIQIDQEGGREAEWVGGGALLATPHTDGQTMRGRERDERGGVGWGEGQRGPCYTHARTRVFVCLCLCMCPYAAFVHAVCKATMR